MILRLLLRLHRHYDAMPEPWREIAILADMGLLTFAIGNPMSPPLSVAAAALMMAVVLSRIRYAPDFGSLD